MHTDEKRECINEADHPEKNIIGNIYKLKFSEIQNVRVIA